MNLKSILSLFALVSLLSLVACGSTSTPDMKLIMILNCGGNADDCDIEADGTCEGRGRWNDLGDHEEIAVADTSGDVFKHHDLEMGTYDDVNNICMFSEDIDIKASGKYRITIGDLGPFDITKSTLENQNWTATLEFND